MVFLDDDDLSDDEEGNENTELILPSDSIAELLKTLEFNAIDMYRYVIELKQTPPHLYIKKVSFFVLKPIATIILT